MAGKGKVRIQGEEAIDLWSSQPPKTADTPCFNRLSMERFFDLDVRQGERVSVEVVMVNEDVAGGVGTAFTLAGRLGGHEVVEKDHGLMQAVEMARSVDVPIVLAGLSADYESENSDRKHLRLPPGADDMIQAVLEANSNAVSCRCIVTDANR